jgi:hypothetical protein
VEQWQEVYCRTAVTEVFQYILVSREGPARGRPPEKWSVEFPSIFTETEKEKVEMRLQQASIDSQYVNMGVLNPIEVRESRFGGTDFNIDTTLDERFTEQLQTKAEAEFQMQLMGMEAQAQAMQNPGAPDQAQGEALAQEGDGEGAPIMPDQRENSTFDSLDFYQAHGYKIRVANTQKDVRIGYLVAPDGQRVDTDGTPSVFVVGPHRAQGRKLYRARFDTQGELVEGPYAIGFRTVKAAKQAIASFYPRQNVAGLSPVPEGEAEALRAGWEQY